MHKYLYAIIPVRAMPKKGFFKKYDGSHILNAWAKFIKSGYKILVVEYKGEKMNSIVGFRSGIAKQWYSLAPSDIGRLLKLWAQGLLFSVVKNIGGGEFKNMVYRAFGMKIGKDVFIAADVFIDDMLPELITIEDGVILGLRSTILTHEFTIKHGRFGRVRIGKQAIIGAGATVRCGVTIGEKALVAMDSLVNKDVPPQEEIGGVPEHEIKYLDNLI
jgi:acetyltransferase-like isoleucine patch superfamily enzyme